MLPKKIIMQNFGPFLKEEVDFEQFQALPLFLISGKTGAGKTTIFDAITFALFGDASGGVRSAGEIRSSFASPAEESLVRFSFQHQGRDYLIERAPKQVLQKKNGAGTVTRNQRVQLTIFDDAGNEAEAYTKVERVQAVIFELLHLQKEQFRQIVMLPQGEFRAFLIANSTEKEAVLRSLFGTGFYRAFSEQLKKQKQGFEKEVGDTATRMDQIFRQLDSETGATTQESLMFAREYLVKEKNKLQLEAQQVTEKSEQHKRFRERFVQAERLAAYFQQMDLAQEQEEKLICQQPQIDEKRQHVRERHKAERLRTLYEDQAALAQKSIQQKAELADVQAEQAAVDTARAAWQKEQERLKTGQARWQEDTKRLQQLQSYVPLTAQREKLLQEQTRLLEEKEQQHAKSRELTASEQQQTAELERLIAEQRTEKTWHERQFQEQQFQQFADHLAEMHETLVEQQETIARQQQEAAEQADQLRQVAQDLVADQAVFKQLKSQWASMEIARLSRELIAGEPCPVCGATEHPDPAVHTDFSSEKLQTLQRQLEEKEAALAQQQSQKEKGTALQEMRQIALQQARSQQKENQQAYVEQVADFSTALGSYYQVALPAEWPVLTAFLNEQREKTTTALQQLQEITPKLEALETARDQTKQQQEIFQKALQEMDSQQQVILGRLASLNEQVGAWTTTELQTTIGALTTTCDEHQQQWEKQQEIGKHLSEQRIRLQEKMTQLVKQQHLIEKEETDKHRLLTQKMNEQQITQEQLVQWLEATTALSDLETAIQRFDQEIFALSKQLEQLTAEVTDKERPDMAALASRLSVLEQAVVAEQQRFYTHENHVHQQQELLDQLTDLHQQSTEQLAKLTEITELYQTINGENSAKISLERYVLQWYLFEILHSANARFAQLTNGRYQFELNQQVGQSRGNTGLEINIYDDNAGASRSAHTLSGGESFIAALSLALGLAEVVQNQAGGVAIETLFIDEGFGSLDEDALETAMTALEGIENHGRMIGIISHVKELKDRIPQQIIVSANGTGQSTINYQLEEWSEYR